MEYPAGRITLPQFNMVAARRTDTAYCPAAGLLHSGMPVVSLSLQLHPCMQHTNCTSAMQSRTMYCARHPMVRSGGEQILLAAPTCRSST